MILQPFYQNTHELLHPILQNNDKKTFKTLQDFFQFLRQFLQGNFWNKSNCSSNKLVFWHELAKNYGFWIHDSNEYICIRDCSDETQHESANWWNFFVSYHKHYRDDILQPFSPSILLCKLRLKYNLNTFQIQLFFRRCFYWFANIWKCLCRSPQDLDLLRCIVYPLRTRYTFPQYGQGYPGEKWDFSIWYLMLALVLKEIPHSLQAKFCRSLSSM